MSWIYLPIMIAASMLDPFVIVGAAIAAGMAKKIRFPHILGPALLVGILYDLLTVMLRIALDGQTLLVIDHAAKITAGVLLTLAFWVIARRFKWK